MCAAGGRALITVWATEQENMRKVAKWQPISTPGAAAAASVPAAAERSSGGGQEAGPLTRAAEGAEAAAGMAGGGVPSGDYFVPWHLPFHRVEGAAAAAAAAAVAGSTSAGGTTAGAALLEGGDASGGAGSGGGSSGPTIDSGKGAVVYQRYYHLFERGELDALVAGLPGAAVADSFYDKDNWWVRSFSRPRSPAAFSCCQCCCSLGTHFLRLAECVC